MFVWAAIILLLFSSFLHFQIIRLTLSTRPYRFELNNCYDTGFLYEPETDERLACFAQCFLRLNIFIYMFLIIPKNCCLQITELRAWSCSIDHVLANTLARQIVNINVIRFQHCNLTDSAMAVISQSIKSRENPVGSF